MPRRENKSMPKVENAFLYSDAGSFPVGGREWEAWIVGSTAFYFFSPAGTFTARKELRAGSWYWYAYRKHQGKLYKLYMGKSEDLAPARLVEVADQLESRIRSHVAAATTKSGSGVRQAVGF
jgi:LuxR family transcriptional regulator, maltose regulon positive regulatory protein